MGRTIRLPVRQATGHGPDGLRSPKWRVRKWRVVSLVSVHVLIIGHLVHYWVNGRSLTPAVMSESMRTIELGQVTCGVLMFSVAILTTLLFGRFLCGWACHMGALQDLSAWILRRFGLTPRPFRSRWLKYTPFALAAYLFLWPTFKREVAVPLATWAWPWLLTWLGPAAARPDGFTMRLMTDDFWAGLPRWQVAVPFLLLCGLVSVVFLGTRGVCRYVCPYGGVLDPVERLAPVTVVVDSALCDQCGLCTKSCDMGVRVMEETGARGGVTSTDCIRSLDCVSVCPHGALSLGRLAGRRHSEGPVQLKKPPASLSAAAEATVLVLCFGTLMVVRGAYDAAPLLMSVCISVCVGVIAAWVVVLVQRPSVNLLGAVVKERGRLRWSSWLVLLLACIAGVLLVQAAAVRVVLWRAGQLDDKVVVGWEEASMGRASQEQRLAARAALDCYKRGMSIASGGIGLLDTPSVQPRMAWLSVVLGDLEGAERLMTASMAKMGLNDEGVVQRARLALLRNNRSAAIEGLLSAVEERPSLYSATSMLIGLLADSGRMSEADVLLKSASARRPWDGVLVAMRGDVQLALGRTDEGVALYREAVATDEPSTRMLARYLVIEASVGDWSVASTLLDKHWRNDATSTIAAARSAGQQLAQYGVDCRHTVRAWLLGKSALVD